MEYYVLPSVDQAIRVIGEIDQRIGYKAYSQTWATPIPHPFLSDCLVPFDQRIENCADLFVRYQKISEAAATRRGWLFGFHQGLFGKSISKLEEATFVLQQLSVLYPKAPFFTSKALFLGFISSIYSMKQALKKVFLEAGELKHPVAQKWWEARNIEQYRDNELLKFFHDLNNSEKHHLGSALKPFARYRGKSGVLLVSGDEHLKTEDGELYLGADGAFALKSTKRGIPLRTPVTQEYLFENYGLMFHECRIELIDMPTSHLGQNLSAIDLLQACEAVRGYYETLLDEAFQLTTKT